MFTYKFVVRKGKERHPRVRLTYQRTKAELSLKIELEPEVFFDALSPRPKSENIKWSRLIKFYRSKIDDVKIYLIEHEVPITSVAQIRDYVSQAIFPNSSSAILPTNSFESLQNSVWPLIGANSVAPIIANSPIATVVRPKFATILNEMILNSKSKSTANAYRVTYKQLKTFDKKFELRDFEELYKSDSNLLIQINKQLKTVGGEEYPDLTTYWARHTWATLAAELDVPDSVISLALGHSTAERVTEVYIKRNLAKVDKANRQILN